MLSKWGKKNLCQISLVKFPIVHYQGTVHSIDLSFPPPLETGLSLKLSRFLFIWLCWVGFFLSI